MSQFTQEVSQGERFQFGENWARFLNTLNDERIAISEAAIQKLLQVETLEGQTFLDVGSGSGLSSLAARRLGAKVHSFDYDPQSVACTRTLRERYFPNDSDWVVEQGSALDADYLKTLGTFDIVYSWGVLHHTGDMWRALELVHPLVKPDGLLALALYNDQGIGSRTWLRIKKLYNRLPGILRPPFVVLAMLHLEVRLCLAGVIRRDPLLYFRAWREYGRKRGMSKWHDMRDWVGGLPFEVVAPDKLFHFYQARGFSLKNLMTVGGSLGNNEFVFQKNSEES